MEESRKEGECSIMVIVSLGSGGNQVTFQKVLEWEEVKTSKVPRKLDAGGTGEVEIASVIIKPRRFNLTVRLTTTQRGSLRSLQREHKWQPLTDDGAQVAQVWIETVRARWAVIEDKRRPWFTEIGMVASNV